jgi:hypothetical protein
MGVEMEEESKLDINNPIILFSKNTVEYFYMG